VRIVITMKGLQMSRPSYLPDADYDHLVLTAPRLAGVARSLRITPSPWTGKIDPDDVKIALGQQLDVWPQRIIAYLDKEDRPAAH
jgi:hypothetical protein